MILRLFSKNNNQLPTNLEVLEYARAKKGVTRNTKTSRTVGAGTVSGLSGAGIGTIVGGVLGNQGYKADKVC